MKLPDEAFGRKWPVFVEVAVSGANTSWDIIEELLPEKAVVWEFGYILITDAINVAYWRIALGHKLPTSAAMMNEYEPLFKGLGTAGTKPRQIMARQAAENIRIPCRDTYEFKNRGIVIEGTSADTKFLAVRAWVVVSRIPTEIGKWLR